MAELRSTFTAAAGGVMTDEVGVITGELELVSTCESDGSVKVRVRYAEALDWYTITGAGVQLHDARDHEALHAVLVNIISHSRD